MKYSFEELSNRHSSGNKHRLMPGDIVVTHIGDFIATNDHAPFCTRCPLYEVGCGTMHSICESGYWINSTGQRWLKLVRISDVLEEL
jgi:hypothetical protein